MLAGVPDEPALDNGPLWPHDRTMESPSLIETAIRLPGTLLRLPAATLQALDALTTLSDRIEQLLALLERLEGILARAGAVDFAALGIDGFIPSASDPASALRRLKEGLSGVGTLDERFGDLDGVVTDLSRMVEAVVGGLPGMRRVPPTNEA
jgi:hypothetical protein